MNNSILPDKLHHFIARFPETERKFLIALSGGPDSMALLHAMHMVCKQSGILTAQSVMACWVDHQLRSREEMRTEQKLVENTCRKLGIRLDLRSADLSVLEAEAKKNGIEDAARKERYRLLELSLKENGFDHVLLGHTRDDQAETVLMRVFIGSGLAGLKGMPKERPPFYRPLIEIRKQEILEFLESQSISYSTDSTNLGKSYLRNRVRNEILPVVESVFPQYLKAIETLASNAADADSLIKAMLPDLIDENPQGSTIIAQKLALQPDFIARDALLGIINESSFQEKQRISSRMLDVALQNLRKAIDSADKKTRLLARGAGIDIVLDSGIIKIEKSPNRPLAEKRERFSLTVNNPGHFRIAEDRVITVYYADRGIRLDAFEWPLTIRSIRDGDRIIKANGSTSPASCLQALGLNRRKRDSIPIAEDRNGIVAILASWAGFSDIYRYNERLKNLPEQGFLAIELKGQL